MSEPLNQFVVGTKSAEARLDQTVAQQAGLSRRQARVLIGEGAVFLDGHRCKIASRLVRPGAKLRVDQQLLRLAPAQWEEQQALLAKVRVVRQTADWVLVEKPAGLLTQPSPAGDRFTVLTALAEKFQQRADSFYPVHRLDRPVGGLLVVALSSKAAGVLSAQIQQRSLKRWYLALVRGQCTGEFEIDDPLPARAQGHRVPALTRVLQAQPLNETTSWVLAELDTGRFHQLRLHLAGRGFPILGDSYGGDHKTVHRLGLYSCALRVPGEPVELAWPDQAESPWNQITEEKQREISQFLSSLR